MEDQDENEHLPPVKHVGKCETRKTVGVSKSFVLGPVPKRHRDKVIIKFGHGLEVCRERKQQQQQLGEAEYSDALAARMRARLEALGVVCLQEAVELCKTGKKGRAKQQAVKERANEERADQRGSVAGTG